MDLDGTLTNSRKEVSDKNKEYVQKAAEAGVHIVIASGRPEIAQRKIVERLELRRTGGYMLACNGSHIKEFRKDGEKSLRSITLHPDTIARAAAFARESGVDAFSYNNTGILTENPEGEWLQKEVYNCALPLVYTDCLEETLNKAKIQTHKMVFTASHEDLLLIKEDLPVFGIPTTINRSGLFAIPLLSFLSMTAFKAVLTASSNRFKPLPLRQSTASAV